MSATVRVSTGGVLDASFGVSGWAMRDLADRTGCLPNTAAAVIDDCASFASGLAAYSDGRIAVVGNVQSSFGANTTFNATAAAINTYAAFVDWLSSSGAPDGTRPTQRFALKLSDLGTSAARDALIDATGNLYVAAQTFGVASNSHVGVAKFNATGALASGFQSPSSVSGGIVLAGLASAALSSGDVRGISMNSVTGSVKIGGRGRATFASDGRPRRVFTVQFTATGALDTSYDGDGYAATAPPKADAQGRLAVPNPDGTVILVSGTQDAADPTGAAPNNAHARNSKILLTKLTAAGVPDLSFSASGSIVVPRLDEAGTVVAGSMLGFFPRAALRIAIASDPNDGKYLIAGQCQTYRTPTASDTDACVVRLLANGSIDTTFGSSGFSLASSSGFADVAYGMRLHTAADANLGKIVLAVQSTTATGTDAVILRLLANGTADTSFNGGGSNTVTLPASVTQTRTFSLRIDSSNRYLIGGHLQLPTGAFVPYVARVLNSGGMDASFGPITPGIAYGFAQSYQPIGDAYSEGLAVYDSGRILLSGWFDPNLGSERKTRAYVAALTNNGNLDPSFGVDGIKVLDDDADTLSSEGWLVAIETGGRALVGTTRTVNNANRTSEMRLTRLNFDGSSDTSFNAVGYKSLAFPASATVPAQPQADFLRAFNVDAAGNYYYVGGSTWNDASDGRVPALAKLEAEAITLDSTFRNFYAVRSGQSFPPYQAQYVYAVTNRSATAVTLNTALTGANASKFTLDSVLCATPGVPDTSVCSTTPGDGNNVIPVGFETPCGSALAAGGKCNLLVSFRPALADMGYAEATLNVGDLKAVLAGRTCQLDLDRDANRALQPAVEGLLYLRYLLGFRGAGLLAGIAFPGTPPLVSQVENRIVRQIAELDLDGDNATLGLRDGLMLMRAMLGLKGTNVTNGAVNATGSRNNWTAIQNHLRYTCGAAYPL